MEDKDRMYLEQNIQVALAQKELDIEDAMAIRGMKDVNQAERLLIVRRKKRAKMQMEIAQQNSQMQAQQAQQAAMASSQAKQQEMQMEANIKAQLLNLEAQIDIQRMNMEHEMRREIEIIRAQATLGFKAEEQQFREKLEVLKENRKDDRVKKQADKQRKLISICAMNTLRCLLFWPKKYLHLKAPGWSRRAILNFGAVWALISAVKKVQ